MFFRLDSIVLFFFVYKYEDAKNINQSNSFKTHSFITFYLIKRSIQIHV